MFVTSQGSATTSIVKRTRVRLQRRGAPSRVWSPRSRLLETTCSRHGRGRVAGNPDLRPYTSRERTTLTQSGFRNPAHPCRSATRFLGARRRNRRETLGLVFETSQAGGFPRTRLSARVLLYGCRSPASHRTLGSGVVSLWCTGVRGDYV